MSNVSSRRYVEQITEVWVPNPGTARDLHDLARAADRAYEEIHGVPPEHDDAYVVEARDEEIVAIIRHAKENLLLPGRSVTAFPP